MGNLEKILEDMRELNNGAEIKYVIAIKAMEKVAAICKSDNMDDHSKLREISTIAEFTLDHQ